MNKKGAYLIIIVLGILLSLNLVIAQSNSSSGNADSEDAKITKAYQCIKDKVDKDCSKLTADEQAFALLSVGDYEDCKNEFLKNSNNNECWPASSCKLKETSIALLALDNIGADTNKIKSWLLNQTKLASDLVWYLEVDSDSASACSVNYDSRDNSFNILADKKINSGAGSCLSISENGYWLKISPTCLEKTYTITCDKDFTTTLLYRTQDSSTIHVSQNVHTSVKSGETEEKVLFKCFKQGSVCDYEGSLWASIALNKKGVDTSEFIPYLDAFKDNNKGFFPESFLYILTGSNDFLTSVLNDNFKGKFWQIGTYNKFYNTALAFAALGGQSSTESQQAKDYLLKSQDPNGCWGNIKDTGFLLYTGWPRSNSNPTDECIDDSDCLTGQTCEGGFCRTPGGGRQDCETSGYFCEKFLDCRSLDGVELDSYSCSYTSKICCSKNYELPTCVLQSGFLCNTGETCNGEVIQSSDSNTCCSAQCETQPLPVTDTCTPKGTDYNCRFSCSSDENEYSGAQCDSGSICCLKKSKSYFWIWLLLILIIIVTILIIFRNKVRLLFFRVKTKFRKGPAPNQTRPPFPPPGAGRPMMPPYMRPPLRMPPRPGSPIPTRGIGKDKEFDETLKKLKDMSK